MQKQRISGQVPENSVYTAIYSYARNYARSKGGLFLWAKIMKFLLLFVPLFATQTPVTDNHVIVSLYWCCNQQYRQDANVCYKYYEDPSMLYKSKDFTRSIAAANHPVAINAAMDELVQQAQFSCHGES